MLSQNEYVTMSIDLNVFPSDHERAFLFLELGFTPRDASMAEER